jgi:serine/threonine-protein kinase
VVADRYRIDSQLGAGGMGAVFAASNLLTGKRVALKWMLPAAARSPEIAERLLREAKAAARVSHPNIVDIYDVGSDGEAPFLVMELLSGEPLSARLERGRLSVEELPPLLLPALRGLAAAHRAGVIHRDLKPDNIFLCTDPDGGPPRPRVLDFGISKLLSDSVDNLTRTGSIMGTPFYMAPEQLRGAKDVDARTDVYAIGVIMYELLTGHVPFSAQTFPALIYAIANDRPTPVSAIAPRVPLSLVRIVERAMAREPRDRYASVEELIADLEAFARSPRNEPSAKLGGRRPRAGRVRVIAAFILGVGLLLAGSVWFWSARKPSRTKTARARTTAPAQQSPSPPADSDSASDSDSVPVPVPVPDPTPNAPKPRTGEIKLYEF